MSQRDVQLNIGGMNGGIAFGTGAQATGVGGSIHNHAAQNLDTLIAAIRQELPALANEQREVVAFLVSKVETEARSAQPSNSKINTLLNSVKAICEGAIGNVIAAYLGAS